MKVKLKNYLLMRHHILQNYYAKKAGDTAMGVVAGVGAVAGVAAKVVLRKK